MAPAALLVILVVATSLPVHAAPAPLPVLAGETVIHVGAGVSGLRLRIPQQVTIDAGRIQLEAPDDVGFAWMGLAYPEGLPGLCEFCPLFGPWHIDDARNGGDADGSYFSLGCGGPGCVFSPGSVDLYFAGDGPFTVTIPVDELTGRLDLDATGLVHGSVERIPDRCQLPECGGLSYGGLAREVGIDGRRGFARVFAYEYTDGALPGAEPSAMHPRSATMSSAGSNEPCAYPGDTKGDVSPDPADHPWGCDVLPSSADDVVEGRWAPQNAYGLRPVLFPNGGALNRMDYNFDAVGQQYLGYTITQVAPLAGSRAGAWGLWVTEGITCPSGDFSGCGQG